MIDRAGQVAVVTGGSQGIGAATVAALAARGMTVVAMARDPGRLNDALGALDPAAQARTAAVQVDVSQEVQVEAAVAEVAERFGRIDVLVNSAGVSMNARRRLEHTTTEEWRRLVDTNLTGTYLMCRSALPHLKERGGYILNVLSTGAYRVGEGSSLYAASKFGARALTEALIEEFRDSPVRTTSVSPGPVDTTIWDHKIEPPAPESRARMMRPSDIADIFVWLLDRPANLHIPDITVTPWTATG
ncbi:SDR family oxidoreductase [Pseudonocardia sp.]|jgi:NADP-dependent 3-hydroxy acid dehydrogenase YdfG|uniref:SDR family oxidoreductase n=1 Tax=Pseudonocardia sp. TaxID=60912 RepID=UPI0031FCD9A8